MKAVATDFEQARQRARWLTMTLGVLGLGTYVGLAPSFAPKVEAAPTLDVSAVLAIEVVSAHRPVVVSEPILTAVPLDAPANAPMPEPEPPAPVVTQTVSAPAPQAYVPPPVAPKPQRAVRPKPKWVAGSARANATQPSNLPQAQTQSTALSSQTEASAPEASVAPPQAAPRHTAGEEAAELNRLIAIVNEHKHYPRRARQNSETGRLTISVTLDSSGKVSDVSLASGHPSRLLQQAALEAAQPLRGLVTKLSGPRTIHIPIVFTLDD